MKWTRIKHNPTKSEEDPEANGHAESFMKHCQKIWHTSITEQLNPKAELNRHLRMYRTTPHPSTGKSPSEILFGRKPRTRLPHITENKGRKVIVEARAKDHSQKEVQKFYKDRKLYVKDHVIKKGDTVLRAQRKPKLHPPYDPEPYKVVEVVGHQITAERNGKIKTRDAQKWKSIKTKNPTNYDILRQQEAEEELQGEEPLEIDLAGVANTSTPPDRQEPELVHEIPEDEEIPEEEPQRRYPQRTCRQPH